MRVTKKLFLIDWVAFALGDGFECSSQLPEYGPWLAGTDDPPVTPDNGGNFCGGAGADQFIGRIQVEVPEILLAYGDTERLCDLEHNQPGDTTEVVECGRRDDLAVLDNVEIVTGTFREVPVRVKEDRLVPALVVRLDLGKDIVEVVQTLDIGGQALGGIAADRDGDPLETFLVQVAIHRTPCNGNDDNRWFWAFSRVKPEVANAAGDDRADVGVLQVVPAQRLTDRRGHLLFCYWRLDVDRLCRIIEPVNVLF